MSFFSMMIRTMTVSWYIRFAWIMFVLMNGMILFSMIS